MLFLGLYIAVWILIYYLEGTHDAYITLETNEHPPAPDYVKANYYKGKWHTYDTFSYIIFHLAGAALTSFLAVQDIDRTLCLGLLSISVSIRIIFHDLFFDLGVGRSPFTIPTCQGKPVRRSFSEARPVRRSFSEARPVRRSFSEAGWDWWDALLVWFYKTTGLNPFYFKFIPLILSIIFYLIFTPLAGI